MAILELLIKVWCKLTTVSDWSCLFPGLNFPTRVGCWARPRWLSSAFLFQVERWWLGGGAFVLLPVLPLYYRFGSLECLHWYVPICWIDKLSFNPQLKLWNCIDLFRGCSTHLQEAFPVKKAVGLCLLERFPHRWWEWQSVMIYGFLVFLEGGTLQCCLVDFVWYCINRSKLTNENGYTNIYYSLHSSGLMQVSGYSAVCNFRKQKFRKLIYRNSHYFTHYINQENHSC